MKKYNLPLSEKDISEFQLGDLIYLSGVMYTGRDAALPRVVKMLNEGKKFGGLSLEGTAIFHTAFSNAGIGPTSSNKKEIENSIVPLSKYGIKLHIGKGSLSQKTLDGMAEFNSVFAVTPPVTSLLTDCVINHKLIAFPEEGMEAFYEIEVIDFPVIIKSMNKIDISNG